jgi:large subunit ribosomal protein L17
MVPKLFGPIRRRYADRPGGYTRVLRIEPMKEDQAESAILELVDGPKDMRFAMTAKILARRPTLSGLSPGVTQHVKKVTQFREDGVDGLRSMVQKLRRHNRHGQDDRILASPRKVYPEDKMKRDMHYFEDVDDYKPPNTKWLGGKKRHIPDREKQHKKQVVDNAVTP